MPHRRAFLTALALFLAAAPRAAAADPLRGFDDYVKAQLAAWEVPGLAVAVVKDDAVVLARGYGARQLGESAPVDEKTVFPIASCSKAFTAAALAMLVDEGRLSWDDPVTKYLRDFRLADDYATREMTVRDLLCHRSGLPRYDLVWYGTGADRAEVLRRLRFARLNTSFRSQFGYQNIMFVAAGEVIPAVAGKSWDDFVTERLFKPLGMTASSTNLAGLRAAGNAAVGHLRLEEKIEVVPYRSVDNAGPAGSINSTAADMARWLRLQLNGGVFDGERLLTTASLREMHSPQTVLRTSGMGPEGERWAQIHPGSRLLTYGLGWVVREYRGRVVVQHGGSIDGFRSLCVLVPEERLGFVVLTNRGGHSLPEALCQRLLDAYLGGPEKDWGAEMLAWQKAGEEQTRENKRKAERERLKDTHPSLPPEGYAGTYRDALYGDLRIVKEGDTLQAHFGPTLTGTLKHWHLDTYQVTWNDKVFDKSLLTFRLGAKGQVTDVEWDQGVVARRLPVPPAEPAEARPVEELKVFVGTYRRKAPPTEVTVELLHGKLKLEMFGQPVRTLVPIGETRFRAEGAPVPTYLQYTLDKGGNVTKVVLERGESPKVVLEPAP
jgi:CubicO group peptidase (beta-lactamase class C family)